MGTKGDKLSTAATAAAEAMVDDLAELGDVTSKKMFGGYGIFESGVMFGIIDPEGKQHLRVGEATEPHYVEAGSEKHSPMPYWSIPEAVLGDHARLVDWAIESLAVAKAAKKIKKK